MTEVEIIEAVAKAQGVSKSLVSAILQNVKHEATKALDAGESVVLTGFGTLRVEKFRKKPLFGKPREEGFWVKVKFSPSRRKSNGKVRRSSGRREVKDSGTGS
jgi:nucleoid DNA-binding protein